MTNLPLEAATADVIARYKRGNDMLASAAIALRNLKDRIDAGEAGPEWTWISYRAMHLEPHISKRWINVQLQLAPLGATDDEVGRNVERVRATKRLAMKKSREPRGSHITESSDVPVGPRIAVSAEGEALGDASAAVGATAATNDREGRDSVVIIEPPDEVALPAS